MADSARLRSLTEDLLVRDRAVHETAIDALGEASDERVIPHLVEVGIIDAIATDWASFGFPEVLRDRDPPRYLELPEVAWPGAFEALSRLAPPAYDSDYAWVQWETWYSQQDIDPLDGFESWKRQLFRSFLPPVGSLLDTQPRRFDFGAVRWGNTDRSYLAALNAPPWVDAASAADYLDGDHVVFGFSVDGRAYAVPRWLLFPHELANFTLESMPLSLTYCTLCNAPILYERRVGDRLLTFGSSGLLLDGNKVMYDEETESLWRQHSGRAIAGSYLDREATLTARAVAQTDWAAWRDTHPETRVVDLETGYDLNYPYYDGYVGFFEHYWNREDVVQPGVRKAESALPEKADVYGAPAGEPGSIHVYPVETVKEKGPIVDDVAGRSVVVLADATGDVAVYEAPPVPVQQVEGTIVDAAGTEWQLTDEALVSGQRRLDRIPGRRGLWFAFRTQYPDATVVRPAD